MTRLTVGEADPELSQRLNRELTAFNNDATGAHDERQLTVRVTDDHGELIGGLTGWTWGGCGGVNMLWVHADHRRDGWGRKLLAAAEDEARTRGCTRMIVSSLSFQAPGFYRRQGYTETGRTEGLPGDAADHHFWKSLDAGGPRLRLVAVVEAEPENADRTIAYEDAVLALLGRHQGRLERRLRTDDRRTEVQIISFADRAGLDAFLADPERAALRERTTVPPDARVIFADDV